MKNYNIKAIQEEGKGLDDSILTTSDYQIKGQSTPSIRKRCSLSKNELQAKYLKKDFDFSQDEDLQVIFDIISKQNSQKSSIDLMILQNAFKNIKLFQELSNEIPEKQMFNLYKELLHYEYQSRQVVFNQGEIGREFYIILQGSVYIIGNEDKKQSSKNNYDKEEEGIKEPPEQNDEQEAITQPLVQTRTSKLARKLQKKSTFHTFQQKQDLSEQNSESNFQSQPSIVRQSSLIRQGTFQYNHLKRTSSIVYEIDNDITDEEYIKQNYPDYDILAKLEPGTSFGEVALRDSIPRTATAICSGETHFITLKRDAFKRFLEKKTFRMNQTIFKEGSVPQGIYLIRSGEVKLYQEMQLATDKQDRLKNIRHFMRKTDSSKNINLFQAPVSHLGEGQMFGHEDIVNSTQRKSTAICSSSSCTLLFLNKEKFLQLSKRRNTFENATEESAMKELWHREIISKLESFTKNQNEYYRKQELKHKQSVEYLDGKRNSQIIYRKQSTVNSQLQRGVNRSLPLISQVSMLQISQDEMSPQVYNRKTASSIDYNKSFGLIQVEEINFESQQDAKVFNHLQKISQISSSQPKLTWDVKNRYKQEFSDICVSPATEENTPLQSEILIRSSHKSIVQKNQDNTITTDDLRVITESSSKARPYSDISFDLQYRIDNKQQQISTAIQTPNSILNQSNLPMYATPQKSLSQLSISPLSIYENQSPQYKGHRRFLSHQQENLNKILEHSSQTYNNQQTIRKSSMQKDTLKQQIEDSLHVPKKLQKSITQLIENSQNNLDESSQAKLDIDNQMIQVCDSQLIVKRRIENKYPRLVSYNKPSSQPSTSTQINEIQIQQRILKSLKLPKVRKNVANLMDIFKPIISESQKKKMIECEQQEIKVEDTINDGDDDFHIPVKDGTFKKQKKRNNSQNNKSIIDTLHQMKNQLIYKKNKDQSSKPKNLQQTISISILEQKFKKCKKNLSQNSISVQKSAFDIKNCKVSNYSFLDKFNEISHTPKALQQAILLQNSQQPCNI